MEKIRYSMSFTTGALLFRESVLIAEMYIKLNDWKKVRDTITSKNLLQARTTRTSKKVCSELISRMCVLHNSELELLATGTEMEQKCMLWLALCRRYAIIGDFAKEVVHEHFLNLKHSVEYDDFNAFYSNKSQLHPELETVADSTLKKIRQVLFKMMHEVGILMKNNMINALVLSQQVKERITGNNRDDLLFFPVHVNPISGRSE